MCKYLQSYVFVVVLNRVNQSSTQCKIVLSLQWFETEPRSNSSVYLYLTLSRCVNILQVFEKCLPLLVPKRIASESSCKTFTALSDVRGGCHCLYPGCPFICGPTLTSVLSVFIFFTNSAWGQDMTWFHISFKQCYLPRSPLSFGLLQSGLVSNLQWRGSVGEDEAHSRWRLKCSCKLVKCV